MSPRANYERSNNRAQFASIQTESTEVTAYHHGVEWKRRASRVVGSEDREFIAWDGEGAKDSQDPKRQNYVLLGASTGDKMVGENLNTSDMLAFIVQVGKANPTAWHVGFAFDYDTNMILRNLPVTHLRTLRNKGSVRYSRYRIEHIPNKWLQITEYMSVDLKDKFTVRINDMFGFFQCSFLKALAQYIPNDPLMQQLEIIEDGKAARNDFTYEAIDYITRYWTVEIELMRLLANRLRELLYDVGLFITRWHGPGALANYGYKKYGIAMHKAISDDRVYDASRYAYAGGRFERFRIGRFQHGYGIDINSAYPYGISQLPSLSEGTWIHNTSPDSIVEFGVYHIRMTGSPITRVPSPLFHRDQTGNISYPWLTEGWYWSPEVALLRNMPGVEIVEGFEYVGWETRPFGFVVDIYNQRRDLKEQGIASQMALKLFLNSLYGKQAQRVGWERTGRAPTWHQLEWAGWVTSATRAKLYAVMSRIPKNALIAVETDGIYTTIDPAELGITNSKELGQWEVTPFEEIMYVQSGMYSKKEKGEWSTKYRGLDAKSLDHVSIANFLKSLEPGQHDWPTLNGPTTRFVGYRQALWREDHGMGPMKVHHCRWETSPKDIAAGSAGKRVHAVRMCDACAAGANAYDMPHDTVIRSKSLQHRMSHPHDIPWLDDSARPVWRDHEEGMV